MATKIITKNSSTATSIPTAGDLVQGELAVNVTDKRLFTEDSGGAIVELGTNPSTLTVTGAATFSGNVTVSNAGVIKASRSDNARSILLYTDNTAATVESDTDPLLLKSADRIQFETSGSERMRIDASGNLLLGTTSNSVYNDVSGTGIALNAGQIQIAGTGATLYLNRQGSDGALAEFRKDGATVGRIGAKSGDIYIGTGDTGIRFNDTDNAVYGADTTTGSASDGNISLGVSSARFKDLYLSGAVSSGTITTTGAATFGGRIGYTNSYSTNSAILEHNKSTSVAASATTAVMTFSQTSYSWNAMGTVLITFEDNGYPANGAASVLVNIAIYAVQAEPSLSLTLATISSVEARTPALTITAVNTVKTAGAPNGVVELRVTTASGQAGTVNARFTGRSNGNIS